MIRSMTGYGRAEVNSGAGLAIAEIKSVNHRYFDLVLRVPTELGFFEDKIKELIHNKVKRGRITLSVYFEHAKGAMPSIEIDEGAALFHCRQLNKLAKKLKLKDEITLDNLLRFSDAIIYKQRRDLTKAWPLMKSAVNNALKGFINSKNKEGRALYTDLRSLAAQIERLVDKIGRLQPKVISAYRARLIDLSKRLADKKTHLDKGRLEMEVALFAKNCDIQEELIRLKAHLKNFKATLLNNHEAGKELDFISQEIFREANTIASKAEDFNIQNWTISVKSNIEKIREQLGNVE